jgi:hypothetical protein
MLARRELPMSGSASVAGRHTLRRLLRRREDIAVHPIDSVDREEPSEDHYFYRPGEVLVPNEPEQVALFERLAGDLGIRYANAERRRSGHLGAVPPNQRGVTPAGGDDVEPARGPVARFVVRSRSPLEAILSRLERASRGELRVSPNHVLFGCPIWAMEPYGDPTPPPAGVVPQPGGGGDGVSVAVLDSGVPHQYTKNPMLAQVLSTPAEEEPWDYSGPQPVLVYPQGHGSFVAGVVLQAASQSTVTSYRVLDTDGVTDEWSLGHQVALALASQPRVINLSLGTPTRTDQALMGLRPLAAAARGENGDRSHPPPIVVAAAGNLGDRRPFYPAADHWAIAVGAVELVGERRHPVRASFSNHGGWVEACALGVDVLSCFEAKPFRSSTGSNVVEFHGAALWSGTSFAAPHVSAAIAELLAKDPTLDREGVLEALAHRPGATHVPGLGWYVR